MNDTPGTAREHHAHVVVHPVVDATPPYRRVDILGITVGKAYLLEDVVEFMRRAGLEDADHLDSLYVDWQGGGPDVWE